MGADAVGEAATDEQIDQMERLLHDALDAGAMGFSTSQAHTHNDGDGNPVPSRAATRDELLRLAGAVHSHPGTQLELIIAGCLNGFTDDEVDLMTSMSLAADRPLNWNVLGVTPRRHAREAARRRHPRRGAGRARRRAHAAARASRSACRSSPGSCSTGCPGWRETIGAAGARAHPRARAIPTVRARLDEQAHSPEAGVLANLARWERLEVIEAFTPADAGVRRPPHRRHREGAGQGAVRRAARHRGRRRAAHRPAPQLRRSRARRDVEDARRRVARPAGDDRRLRRRRAPRHDERRRRTRRSSSATRCATATSRSKKPCTCITDKPARLYGAARPRPHRRGRVRRPRVLRSRRRSDRPASARSTTCPAARAASSPSRRACMHVLVNGTEIVRDATYTGATPGTVSACRTRHRDCQRSIHGGLMYTQESHGTKPETRRPATTLIARLFSQRCADDPVTVYHEVQAQCPVHRGAGHVRRPQRARRRATPT